MAKWLTSCSSIEQAKAVASQIDSIWKSTLGTSLYNKWIQIVPMMQARTAIRSVIPESAPVEELEDLLNKDDFSSSIAEVMDILRELPEWPDIEAKLGSMKLDAEIDSISSSYINF